jgi:hypothetical protein
VTEPRRPAALALVSILSISLVAVIVACNPTVRAPTPSPTAGAPSLTPVPGGASAKPSASASVSQTDTKTEVGRIWDNLPPSFPRIKGQAPVETGGDPTSGTFAVGGSVDDTVAAMRAALTELGYNVDVASPPLEDGSVVLDAGGGPDPDCRIEVRFTPLSDMIAMAVLYGAACPFS